jgi:ankyrin repeat protein
MGSPLLFAVILNNQELLSQLLELKSVDKLSPTTQQQLLFESARRDAPGCLELLLQRGVPIDIKDTAGFTLFLRSLDMGEFDLSLWLLQKGAAIDFLAGGKLSPTDSVLFELSRMEEGDPDARLLLEIKRLMQERGAIFPAAESEHGVHH